MHMAKRWKMVVLMAVALSVFMGVTGHMEERPMTRLEFYETVMKTMEQRGTIRHFGVEGEPFGDVSNPYVSEAYALGLVKGDDCGNFNPDMVMTREQAAVALKRVQDYIVPRLIYDNRKAKAFGDRGDIADYAVSSVMQLSMTGTIGGGRFDPKGAAGTGFVNNALQTIYGSVVQMPVSRPGALPKKMPPVLMYHSIGESLGRPYAYLYVTPAQFEEQVKYMADNGYTFLFPDEMYYADRCEKPVVITFDDGYVDNFDQALPVLKRYNAKATVFVAGSNIDQQWMLTKQQIRQMADSGLVNIGSHTLAHGDLTKLDGAALQEEMAGSQWLLEKITGKKITNIAYPFGKFNDAVIAQAKRYFACGFSVNKGSEGNLYTLRRVTVDGRDGLDVLQRNLKRFQ